MGGWLRPLENRSCCQEKQFRGQWDWKQERLGWNEFGVRAENSAGGTVPLTLPPDLHSRNAPPTSVYFYALPPSQHTHLHPNSALPTVHTPFNIEPELFEWEKARVSITRGMPSTYTATGMEQAIIQGVTLERETDRRACPWPALLAS